VRSSVADRERSIDVLKRSFVEGRLTRDELDERLGRALVSRAFEELMALTADLPVGPFGRLPMHPSTPRPPQTNRPFDRPLLPSPVANRAKSDGIGQARE
jgi:Domain of unknown function (DUF1707)